MIRINSKRGCNFGGKIVNHFLYADDMSVLTAKCLQMLLDICQGYAQEHNILFNLRKTVCMIISTPDMKLKNTPKVPFNGNY